MSYRIKGILFFFTLCFSVSPAMAKPVLWHGVPVKPDEKLLAGQLNIKIENGVVKGEINDLSATSRLDGNKHFTLTFKSKSAKKLSASDGAFRGYITNENELRGHWIRYGMRKRASYPYATPVRFSKNGNQYSGAAEPLKDELSLFFITEPKSEDRYKIKIFVPENNVGRFYRKTELVLADEKAIWWSVLNDEDEEFSRGTYDEGLGFFHLQLPDWGGDVRFDKRIDDSQELLAAKRHQPYQIPAKKDDGWPVGHADKFNIDSAVLEGFADKLRSEPAESALEAQTEAFLVARNGVLIFEQYFRGYEPDVPHDLRSASKSLTGILPGLVEQAGLVDKNDKLLETGIYETLEFKTDDAKKQQITLEHALSMSTGLDCDDNQQDSPGNEDTMQYQQEELDWFRYILRLDAVHKPGTHLAYCSGGINLAGPVLTAKTELGVPVLIEELFAQPLGIKKYHINLLPDGQQAYSGGGLQLLARDFLKMGQLMLNKGRWGDKQLLAPAYVENVLTPRGEMFGDQYGLGWWLRTYQVDGHDYQVFYAGGNGGQQIMAVPELDLVAVSLGSAYGTRGTFKMRDDWFPNIILSKAIKTQKGP